MKMPSINKIAMIHALALTTLSQQIILRGKKRNEQRKVGMGLRIIIFFILNNGYKGHSLCGLGVHDPNFPKSRFHNNIPSTFKP